MVIFSIMRIPWGLSYFSFIDYNPILFYSYVMEILVTPIMLTKNINMKCFRVQLEKQHLNKNKKNLIYL